MTGLARVRLASATIDDCKCCGAEYQGTRSDCNHSRAKYSSIDATARTLPLPCGRITELPELLNLVGTKLTRLENGTLPRDPLGRDRVQAVGAVRV